MRTFIISSSPNTPANSTADLSLSISCVLALLAGHTTLLVDLSDTPEKIRKAIGILGTHGVENLARAFIVNQANRTDQTISKRMDILPEIISLPLTMRLEYVNRIFHILPGPQNITDEYLDLLAENRGDAFTHALMDELPRLNFDYAVVNLGARLDTNLGLALTQNAELVAITDDGQSYATWGKKRFDRPIKIPQVLVDSNMLHNPFPDPEFITAGEMPATREHSALRQSIGAISVAWPGILKEITKPNGKPMRAFGLFDRLL